VLAKKLKPSNSTPIFRGWKRISLALEGHFLSSHPIKPRHVAKSGGATKAKPCGHFVALTSPPFFRLFMLVADGRECLRRGFRTGIHDEGRKPKGNSLNAGIYLKYPVPNCRLLIRAKEQSGILP